MQKEDSRTPRVVRRCDDPREEPIRVEAMEASERLEHPGLGSAALRIHDDAGQDPRPRGAFVYGEAAEASKSGEAQAEGEESVHVLGV
ncbi:MAG: hypothetical protein AMXMBFR64_55450 [Myxococcales bacterium]